MIKNYLTVDVEDYFHVSAFSNRVRYEEWNNYESRVVSNTKRILEILNRAGDIKGTFFILGWVAEKHPGLVKEIDAQGHEIGCHSYRHKLVYDSTPKEFRSDLIKARDILEGITGKKIFGYRAPSYSITNKSLWAFEILAELGFTYDSSIFPISHDRYGIPDAPRFNYWLPEHGLREYPISTAKILGIKVPVSGGGYLRLFPYWFTKIALKKINYDEMQPFVFYIHPWEIDPQQPRIKGATLFSRFRHYNNLEKAENRFTKLLQDFQFTPIIPQFEQSECLSV
ncbi:MAG: DUF3473 domain-containing protein [Candidatus Scalindua sp. AMX11]|nr:MAG: DUF3473 domain-containing protein [Candidatus Scalindua sp.]NOG82698.1 DUF3473 domain-containing protein [Planctomycetota bacterium]RZV95271.1 MAG: DUF3473 domain-containing protein [Candidatus Scalindua sp. SCAELEC01]TDE66249.1 MAG: DUF3473 domain-containing protein [Candidatus Scalindua sp. AMX11]GJQ57871.1 MAG: polysaccharide deacetylase [Candidatus Scalindua sp.]